MASRTRSPPVDAPPRGPPRGPPRRASARRRGWIHLPDGATCDVGVINTGGTVDMEKEEGIASLGGKALDFEQIIRWGTRGAQPMNELTEDVLRLHVGAPPFRQDSSDALPRHIASIADEAIRLAAKGWGVVVSHGTDTAAHTAVGLGYRVWGPARVTVTGAQAPARAKGGAIDASSDAFRNLQDAAFVAGCLPLQRPTITFAGRVHAAENLVKARVWSEAPFESVGMGAVASVVGARRLVRWHGRGPREPPAAGQPLRSDPVPWTARVAVVPIVPGLPPRALSALLGEVDGLVLEALGAGHVTTRRDAKRRCHGEGSLIPPLQEAARQGKPIVICTRGRGPVDLSTGYELGRLLLQAGMAERDGASVANVVSGGHLVGEHAYLKLLHVLSHARDVDRAAGEAGLEPETVRHALLAGGVGFRDPASRRMYERITGVRVPPRDLLVGRDVRGAAREAAVAQA